jgi:tetratricopeptide (TPR) repeat protein
MISLTAPQSQAANARSRVAISEAMTALRAGNPADAERTLNRRLSEQPDDVEVLAALADILGAQRRNLEASLLCRRALAHAPQADRVRLALARSLQRQSQFEHALKEIEQLGQPMRMAFEARIVEAALLGRMGLQDRELAVYEALLTEHPNHEALWMSYGLALKTVGRTDEAVNALRRAIKERPTYGEAYWTLANLKTFRFEGRDIAAMRRALEKPLSPDDAVHFHFSLGKAFEDRNNAAESFKHYAHGNRMFAERWSRDQMSATWFVNSAIETFDSALFDRLGDTGHPSTEPIFVVGLQRSGSTLIEQILASHPQIEGTAELTVIEELWMRFARAGTQLRNPFEQIADFKPETFRDFGAEYLERTAIYRHTDRPFFVDKQPANWMHVGFIKLILPNARIIDARRHPMACGFSNFRQFYSTGVIFSYGLDTIGRFYADYLRLMNHFDRVLPGAVHRVINERMIEDPEREIRSLLDYVGVPFDPACLEFHRTERAVHSASSEQVRRPINREGLDYWRKYEAWLGPLKEALGDALDDWDKA